MKSNLRKNWDIYFQSRRIRYKEEGRDESNEADQGTLKLACNPSKAADRQGMDSSSQTTEEADLALTT